MTVSKMVALEPRSKRAKVLKFTARRIALIPLSMFVVVSLCFFLTNLLPGDVAMEIAGDMATDERIQEIRSDLGIDKPILTQYSDYLSSLLRGDLGESYFTNRSVSTEILERLPSSLELVIPSLVFACLIGLAIGSIAAYFRARTPDRAVRVVISFVQSVPDFLLALTLIYVVFFILGIAPAPVGRFGLLETKPDPVTYFYTVDALIASDLKLFKSILWHMLLPVLSLSVVYSVYFAKTTRAAMNVAFASPQIEFARACGLRERTVFHYALLTARTPILTYGAILTGALVGGAAIVETIFAWRGLGQWALISMLKLDLPVIQGFVLVVGAFTLLIYLVLDIIILYLDPRISYR